MYFYFACFKHILHADSIKKQTKKKTKKHKLNQILLPYVDNMLPICYTNNAKYRRYRRKIHVI